MTSYRVVRRKHADLSGEGARLYGGRFNPPGVPAVYTSRSIALALLEVMVHLDRVEVPTDYVVMAFSFAGKSVSRPRSGMAGARHLTPAEFTAAFRHRPIVRVASVIVPREFNYVFFPAVSGFRASVDWIEPLEFDGRLFASLGI